MNQVQQQEYSLNYEWCDMKKTFQISSYSELYYVLVMVDADILLATSYTGIFITIVLQYLIDREYRDEVAE